MKDAFQGTMRTDNFPKDKLNVGERDAMERDQPKRTSREETTRGNEREMSGSIHFAPGSLIVAARKKTNEDAFARRPRQQRLLSAKQALMKKQSETLQVESYISPAEKAEGPG
ncbi:hypothetical protein CIHG_00030 [Coccidioides immitis H538.4]|uniref:Uncharacterized protein n=1 Tax=Coccidioides immitis H538.4 TaxID=396776 RepID=A0A0J8RE77_COCIT|nr:hypothetical protein CIHG_00030 [Coccidioides immitis H538.4]